MQLHKGFCVGFKREGRGGGISGGFYQGRGLQYKHYTKKVRNVLMKPASSRVLKDVSSSWEQNKTQVMKQYAKSWRYKNQVL